MLCRQILAALTGLTLLAAGCGQAPETKPSTPAANTPAPLTKAEKAKRLLPPDARAKVEKLEADIEADQQRKLDLIED